MPDASFSVERANPRFSLVADAEVTALWDGSRIVALVSQLSARGCYVDTINPFSIGTVLHLRIRYGSSTCEVQGKVIHAHPGSGMGVLFENVAVEQKFAMDSWLSELARESTSSTR